MTRSSSRRSSSSSRGSSRSHGGGFFSFLRGFLLACLLIPATFWLYLRFGHPSAALRAALPFASRTSSKAPSGRSHAALSPSPYAVLPAVPLPHTTDGPPQPLPQPPFGIGEDVFESGARTYAAHCAGCHGTPSRLAGKGTQLWKRHGAMVGVSSQPPGAIFNAIRLGVKGPRPGSPPLMPAYQHVLTPTQIWQLALLLKNADQPLPDPVQSLLRPDR